jgi:hypothetical protein
MVSFERVGPEVFSPFHFSTENALQCVPARQSIVVCANTFRRTGSVEKRRSGVRPVGSPQNIEAVKQPFYDLIARNTSIQLPLECLIIL